MDFQPSVQDCLLPNIFNKITMKSCGINFGQFGLIVMPMEVHLFLFMQDILSESFPLSLNNSIPVFQQVRLLLRVNNRNPA